MAQRTKPALCSVTIRTPGEGQATRGAHGSRIPALRPASLHLAYARRDFFSSHITLGTPLKCQDRGLLAGHSSPRATAGPSDPSVVAFPLQGRVAEDRSMGQCLRRALCLFLATFVATQPCSFVCGRFYATGPASVAGTETVGAAQPSMPAAWPSTEQH